MLRATDIIVSLPVSNDYIFTHYLPHISASPTFHMIVAFLFQ